MPTVPVINDKTDWRQNILASLNQARNRARLLCLSTPHASSSGINL